MQRPVFFMHSLSSSSALTLDSLRALIHDVYLTRFDARIAELRGQRRDGRPKGKELGELEEVRRREWTEWETGLGEWAVCSLSVPSRSPVERACRTVGGRRSCAEVPDLTDPPTADQLHRYTQLTTINASHFDTLRFIRVCEIGDVVVSRKGRLGVRDELEHGEGDDWTTLRGMEVDAVR